MKFMGIGLCFLGAALCLGTALGSVDPELRRASAQAAALADLRLCPMDDAASCRRDIERALATGVSPQRIAEVFRGKIDGANRREAKRPWLKRVSHAIAEGNEAPGEGADEMARMPANLVCAGDVTGYPTFRISGLKTGRPASTFYDAPLANYVVDSRVTRIEFTNECDNLFSLVFFTEDLTDGALAEHRKTVPGFMTYYYSDLGDEPRTTSVRCKTD